MNNRKGVNDEYQLILLKEEHIKILYSWHLEEKHFERYTCRPFDLCQSFDEYAGKILKAISEGKSTIYVLVKKENNNLPLGKISLFDLNLRNHSAEFGYYLPNNNRSKGLGSIILAQFIENSFKDDKLNLNKIYATTSSNNISSTKILEKFGFKLEGRLREHYWISENKYDQLIYSMLKNEWIKGNIEKI